jgi:hypothetical protein
VYPRKESKPQAEKAWKRLKLDGIADRIVADVLARMDNGGPWKGTEKRFILLPATYLNGQRWLDEWQTTTRSRVGTVAADSRTEAEVLAANEAALVRLGVGA